jgi:signal transduction histidine kinase
MADDSQDSVVVPGGMALLVHDLKAPIARIRAARDFIAEDHPPPEMVDKALAIIDASARALERMTNNLLDLDRGERGALRLAPSTVDLHALCTSIAARANEMAAMVKSGVRIETALERAAPEASLDRDRMQRAIESLVDDAARNSGDGGLVKLETSGDATTLRIAISDGGRSHGLGLQYCELVAKAHGGSLRVETAESGARIVIEIPQPVGAQAPLP